MARNLDRAWQRMLSGRRLDILSPSALDVEMEDIALGLSRVVRWNGQTAGEYGFSVAQHSVLVVELISSLIPRPTPPILLAGLLHDAPEYVTSDLITPFKRAIGKVYCDIEGRVAQAVHLAFGLPPVLPNEWERLIKKADRMAAVVEAVELAGFAEAEARRVLGYRGSLPSKSLTALSAEDARKTFLDIFAALIGEVEAFAQG